MWLDYFARVTLGEAMIPPHVRSNIPSEGGTFSGNVIEISGSLLGILFEEAPPTVWDLEADCAVPVTWKEEVTHTWHSEAPAVGGDIQTRVEIFLATVVSGRKYRLRYPSSLSDFSEAVLTAE